MPEKFLITGATGKTAELAIEHLVAQRADVRALVRDLGKAAPLKEKGVELTQGDFHDSDSLVRALDGVTSVFLVTPPDEHTAATVDRFLAAVTTSGKHPRIVRLSAIKASEGGPTDNTRQHGRAEVAGHGERRGNGAVHHAATQSAPSVARASKDYADFRLHRSQT